VIEQDEFFKVASLELEARPADESAAIRVIRAHHDSEAPRRMTALLLGCIGHWVGLETVNRILVGHPSRIPESYAGVALARIAGPETAQDPLRIVFNTSHHIKTRCGARYGLACLAMPKFIADSERALDERCLPLSDAAGRMAACGPKKCPTGGRGP